MTTLAGMSGNSYNANILVYFTNPLSPDDLKGKLVQLDRDIDNYCKDYEQMEFEAWKRTQDRNLQQYKLDKK
jgi:hypothetical protein